MEHLTEFEKAAIVYHVFAGCKDRKILFQIAEGEERVKRLKPKSLDTTCNNWINSHKIQEGIKLFKTIQEQRKDEIITAFQAGRETENENTTRKNEVSDKTNFLDRDEFLQFLNSRANAIQDDKLRNDILKMLSDNLRYKDTERDENNEIQRFYTPVTCENCTIYQKCKDCKLSNCPAML